MKKRFLENIIWIALFVGLFIVIQKTIISLLSMLFIGFPFINLLLIIANLISSSILANYALQYIKKNF